jgi:DNA (cytosine-5)-methyltransferase 1
MRESVDGETSLAAIDLFAGAGGLSLGIRASGCCVAAAVDHDKNAALTYEKNHPDTVFFREDIRAVSPSEVTEACNGLGSSVFLLAGGPPCEGFSESNKRSRTLANPKNSLFRQVLRFAEELMPLWFLLENVPGLLTLAKGAVLDELRESAKGIGYETFCQVLNAADYGVPQHRRRLFVVGTRLPIDFHFPISTHGSDGAPYITVREALQDLPRLSNGASEDLRAYSCEWRDAPEYAKTMRRRTRRRKYVQGNLVTRNSEVVLRRYEHIAPGENWEAIPEELLGNYKDSSRCHTGIYYRLVPDEPAKVIGNFRKNMLIHYGSDRGVSVREAARLQSFPDDYEFLGSIGFRQQQVANAVPPMLAQKVVGEIVAQSRSYWEGASWER